MAQWVEIPEGTVVYVGDFSHYEERTSSMFYDQLIRSSNNIDKVRDHLRTQMSWHKDNVIEYSAPSTYFSFEGTSLSITINDPVNPVSYESDVVYERLTAFDFNEVYALVQDGNLFPNIKMDASEERLHIDMVFNQSEQYKAKLRPRIYDLSVAVSLDGVLMWSNTYFTNSNVVEPIRHGFRRKIRGSRAKLVQLFMEDFKQTFDANLVMAGSKSIEDND